MKLLSTGAADLGIHLSLAQVEQFRRYYTELVGWNSRVNLTSVTRWKNVQSRHFLDSLTVSLSIPPDLLQSGRFLDVGSGAGFPGMPLKLAFPGTKATLMDSVAKKTTFLVHLREVLGLEQVEIRTGRAEILGHDHELRESFDIVLARAVARLATLAELALPFCRLGGIVVAQKNLKEKDEISEAKRAIEIMGGRLKEVREVSLAKVGEARGLVVLEKVHRSPERYPRRPGMPKKRPL